MKKFKMLSWDEIEKAADEEVRLAREGVESRKLAILRTDNLTIVLNGGYYYVDLEQITTAADVCEWLAQLNDKTWFTPQMQADFLYYLNDYWFDLHTSTLNRPNNMENKNRIVELIDRRKYSEAYDLLVAVKERWDVQGYGYKGAELCTRALRMSRPPKVLKDDFLRLRQEFADGYIDYHIAQGWPNVDDLDLTPEI